MEQLVGTMHQISAMSGGIELFAGLITFILFIGSIFEPSRKTPIGKILMAILLIHTVMQASDAFLWFLIDRSEFIMVIRVLNTVSYVAGGVILILYVYCALLYISQKKPVSMKPAHIMAAFCSLAMAAWIASNFNGMYYYFDENGVYCYGPFAWVNMAIWYGMLFSSILIVLHHRTCLGWRDTCILISFGILPILAAPLDSFWEITPRYMATALSIIMVYMCIHIAQSKILLQKELELSDSKVRLLLGQIQPHFIFNSLQSIEELCFQEPLKAAQMVHDFSRYLRANLDAMSCDHLISFQQELEHIRHYLALEQSDPESRLQVVYYLHTTEFYVPPLSVQPIVENAVRHGIGTRSQGGDHSNFSQGRSEGLRGYSDR